MSNWNNSFDPNWLSWFAIPLPWLVTRIYTSYQKYGALKTCKIIFSLVSVGFGIIGVTFATLALAGMTVMNITGQLLPSLSNSGYSPLIMFAGISFIISIHFGGGLFMLKQSLKEYKKLTHSNPIGI